MLLPSGYLNTSCQLQSTNNNILGTGRIVELEIDHMIIESTADAEFPPIAFLSFVKVILNSPSIGTHVCITNVSESTPDRLRLSNIIILTSSERRGYYRVRYNVETDIFTVPNMQLSELTNPNDEEEILISNDSAVITQQPYNIQPIHVLIHDISLSGILFETSAYLQIGQRVIIELVHRGESEFYLAMVKRRFKNEMDDAANFQYGCVFNEKNVKKTDKLCRLVMDQQAKLIQRAKR